MAAALSRLIGTTRGRITLLVETVSVVWLVTSAVNHVAFHAYSSFGECLWWGFVHLIDPRSSSTRPTRARPLSRPSTRLF